MADAPWRCTQCGTVNEPNANACRSCGRWPSLFDLERSEVDVEPGGLEDEFEETTFTRAAPSPREARAPVEMEPPIESPPEPTVVPGQEWPGPEDPLDRPMQGWPARLASWIVPIAFLVYIAISIIANR